MCNKTLRDLFVAQTGHCFTGGGHSQAVQDSHGTRYGSHISKRAASSYSYRSWTTHHPGEHTLSLPDLDESKIDESKVDESKDSSCTTHGSKTVSEN